MQSGRKESAMSPAGTRGLFHTHNTAIPLPGSGCRMFERAIPHASFTGITVAGAQGESHDREYDDKTDHDQAGNPLCFVQGESQPHEPHCQSRDEIAVHVIEKSNLYYIKYFVHIPNNRIILILNWIHYSRLVGKFSVAYRFTDEIFRRNNLSRYS